MRNFKNAVSTSRFEAAVNVFASVVSWLWDGYWPTAQQHDDLSVRIRDGRRRYTPLRLFASGDVADVHLATAAGETDAAPETLYLLKVARVQEGNAHLDNERKALTTLLGAAGETTYREYLPALVDSFTTADRCPRRVNVFRWDPGFHTLEQVHEQHPALDGRHLAWIFKRLLTVLGFCHRRDVVHGAVLPCHVLIHAAGHGLKLVGWGRSITVGRRITAVPACHQDWYPAEVQRRRPAIPATDLFLAARCLVYLAGGDPVTSRMPDAVPRPIRQFVNTCLLESASMRPDDAWALVEDFDDLLRAIYGPPKFHELTLT
jgi:serine/threonine protein kinase